MLTTAALFLCLSDPAGAATPHAHLPTFNCEWCADGSLPAAEARPRDAKYEEQDFLRRFNGLATALTDFSTTYNSQGVIDVKKVKAIRKALHELEKSDWFSRKGK